jgi:hypothetical protein
MSLVRPILLALICVATLPAQTPTSLPAANSASPAQASEEMTRKITDLVHAGKYSEAQQLTTGLLIAYPDDQRLIKAKALIDRLLASPSAESTPSAQPPAVPSTEELTGMDKVDYNALLELAREAQQTTDPAEQNKLLTQFMEQSDSFLRKHPSLTLLWQLRAATAIGLDLPIAGYEAGENLLAAGAANSNDPGVQRLLGQLRNKGWLNKDDAERLQLVADRERQQKHEVEERLRNTFPVVHARVGFGANGYGYGHMVFTLEGMSYEGTDENVRLQAADIREVKVACNTDACGMYFTPRSGRKYFFLAVTEEAVTNRTDKGKIFLKPAVLGNAVVRRWGFVKADEKTLVPPPGGFVPKAPEATVTPVRTLLPVRKSVEPLPAPAINDLTPQVAPVAPVVAPVSLVSGGVNQPGIPPLPAPRSEKAILHLYRQHTLNGAPIKPHILIDGTEVTQVANGQTMQTLVEPGKHTISVEEKRAKTDLPINDLEMEAGKEYWVRVEITSKFLNYIRLYLEPNNRAEIESRKLHEVEPWDSSKRK